MIDPADFDPRRAQSAMRRGLWSIALGVVLIGLALLAVSKSELGAEAFDDLRNASHPALLGLSWGIISMAFLFMGLRWRALMPPPHRPPALGLTSIVCAGLLLNYAVPGPFGELGAAWFANKRYRVPLADALATGVAARLIGLATSALMAVLVWLFVELPPPSEDTALLHMANQLIPLGALTVGVGGILLFALALRPSWWKHLSALTLGRWHGTGMLAVRAQQLNRAVASLADALARAASRGRRAYGLTAFWSVAGHTTVIAGIAVAAHGLGATPNLAGLAFTYVATTAGAVALFAFPASQMGWDLMFFSLLVAAAGLPAPIAGAIAVLVRLQQLSMMLIGALSLAWLLNTTPRNLPDG